jgi:uncharacterized protein YndB with AHSA1/START domain
VPDTKDTVSVSMTIAAPPDEVYGLVSDVTRMGEWSPECVRCKWLDGDRKKFRGYNRKGFVRWSTNATVVRAEPGKEFTFDVHAVAGIPVARWSYRFTPAVAGGTVVTESWEDHRAGPFKTLTGLAIGVSDRAEHNRKGMEQTLERIKAAAEGS